MEVAYVIFKACVGIGLTGVGLIGFLFVRAGVLERMAFLAAGITLILALPLTDEIGFALGLALVGLQVWRLRKERQNVGDLPA